MSRRAVTMIVLSILLLAGCGQSAEERSNVRPPTPGTPARAADVQGIYRTVHQGLLQLRGDGSFVLIVSGGPGPSAGTYALEDGRLTVRTEACGAAVGDYRVEVGGEPVAGKATLHITAVRDDCEERRRFLTLDPWVYANS